VLSQWLLFIVSYDEPVVVNHGLLCGAKGCEIALTYQNEKLKKRVDKCGVVCNSSIVME
jgi:enoyl-[acyl-carrier-protein] reductase (NADH)